MKSTSENHRSLLESLALARDFPDNTDPASRHVEQMGESLIAGKAYPSLSEDPIHCAQSMLEAVKSLYEARAEVLRLQAEIARQAKELEALGSDKTRAIQTTKMLGRIIHDMVCANQSAWIEWRHGRGAEFAMTWVHNGLAGPGQIPDEDAPYGKEPQAWYDANCADPMPQCHCGRPSNIAWMGQGFCCKAHYDAARSGSATGEG